MIQRETLIMTIPTAKHIAGFRIKMKSKWNVSDLQIAHVRHLPSIECRNSSLSITSVVDRSNQTNESFFEVTFDCSTQHVSTSSMIEGNFVIIHFNRPIDCGRSIGSSTCLINAKLYQTSDSCDQPDQPLFARIRFALQPTSVPIYRFQRETLLNDTADQSRSIFQPIASPYAISNSTFTEISTSTTNLSSSNTEIDVTNVHLTFSSTDPALNFTFGAPTSSASFPETTFPQSTVQTLQSTTHRPTFVTEMSSPPSTETSMESISIMSSSPPNSDSNATDPHFASTSVSRSNDSLYARYTCQNGFRLQLNGATPANKDGEDVAQDECKPNEDWSYILPKCVPIMVCLLPAYDPNVRVLFNQSYTSTQFLIKQELRFECRFPNQTLLGSSVNYCSENGTWSGGQPRCDPPLTTTWMTWIHHSAPVLLIGTSIVVSSTFSLVVLVLLIFGLVRLRRSLSPKQAHLELGNQNTYQVSDAQFRFESDTIARRHLPSVPYQDEHVYEAEPAVDHNGYLDLEPTAVHRMRTEERPKYATINRSHRQSRRKRLSEVRYVECNRQLNNPQSSPATSMHENHAYNSDHKTKK